ATVSASAPGAGTATGTVQFKDGSTVIDTETLSGGSATFSTSALAVASHSISAVYSGDGNFTASTSTRSQTSHQDGTSTTRTSRAHPSVPARPSSDPATVSASAPGAGTPTGTVQFKDGSTVLDTETLSAGSATFSTSALSVAGHGISAVYSGDGNF